jgi:hypothetical protein
VNLQMYKMLSSTSLSILLPLQCLARPIFYLQGTLYCARLFIILEPLQMDRLSAMVCSSSRTRTYHCPKTNAELDNGIISWRISISYANTIAIAL